MQTRAYYLQRANAAVAYVKSKMSAGAGNNVWDIVTSGLTSSRCVVDMRTNYKTEFFHMAPAGEQIRIAALWAEQHGCGNCGEQAALAYQWLLEQKVSPLEYMNLARPKDHAFVVLGRVPGSQISNPSTWGPAAVVCDPWKYKAYPAAVLYLNWPGGVPQLVEPAPTPPAPPLSAAAGRR